MPADVPLTGVNTRPGEKPPVMPAVATQDNAKGAQAFGAFFIRTLDWGYATMSSTYMRHYFDPACNDCTEDAKLIDKAARALHRYVGGRVTVLRSKLASYPYGRADATALVAFKLTRFRELDRHGTQVYTTRGYAQATFQVSVLWEIDRWKVYALGAKA